MSYPSPPKRFEPLFEPWPKGTEFWRCHPVRRGPLEANATTASGRFRPVYDKGRNVVPTCYAADTEHAAIAEGPFHDLPISSTPKHLARAISDARALTPLSATRDLNLVTFRGHGLRRIGETQASLIEPGPACYEESAVWGQAAHDHPSHPDGMIWVSRQFPGGAAMLLFWDRCGGEIRQNGPIYFLATGRGFELLAEAANAAGVLIVES
jgi:RES domain